MDVVLKKLYKSSSLIRNWKDLISAKAQSATDDEVEENYSTHKMTDYYI